MTISIDRHAERDLAVFRASGTVTYDDQMEVLRVFYAEAPTRNVIWDFTQVDDVVVSGDQLRSLVGYTRTHADRRGGGRTALVVNSQLKYGLARMAATFADLENVPWAMAVFEDLEAAMAWIDSDE